MGLIVSVRTRFSFSTISGMKLSRGCSEYRSTMALSGRSKILLMAPKITQAFCLVVLTMAIQPNCLRSSATNSFQVLLYSIQVLGVVILYSPISLYSAPYSHLHQPLGIRHRSAHRSGLRHRYNTRSSVLSRTYHSLTWLLPGFRWQGLSTGWH